MFHLFDKFKKISFVPADASLCQPICDFLADVREPENYLLFVLGKLLNSANSQKIIYSNTVASIPGKIIGFDSRVLFPNHHYWGSALTVDRRFRRLGLARHLISIGEKIARENNINKIRTAVMFDNIPVFIKLGFNALRPWYILGFKPEAAKAIRSKSGGIREAVGSDIGRLERFLSKSDYFILSSEMYVEDLIWYPLDRLWLGDLIKERRVLLNEDKSDIRGMAIINKNSLINPFPDGSFSIIEIGYFDGDWTPILDFISENYQSDFMRVYSANGIPLKCLPAGVKNAYFSRFNDLFGGLNRMEMSEGKLFFTSIMLMQKLIL